VIHAGEGRVSARMAWLLVLAILILLALAIWALRGRPVP
jgi:hypothetical protein